MCINTIYCIHWGSVALTHLYSLLVTDLLQKTINIKCILSFHIHLTCTSILSPCLVIIILCEHLRASVFQTHFISYLCVDFISRLCHTRQPKSCAATRGKGREVKHQASDHSSLECCWRHFLMISLGLLAGSADRLQPRPHWQTQHHRSLMLSQKASICQQLSNML